MKKFLFGIAAAALAVSALFPSPMRAAAEELTPTGRSAYLCDYDSGTVVYQREETKRLPIASMCKIMTLLLSFEAIEDGALTLGEEIVVSSNASGMGGSQVFLQTGLRYSAEELIKTVAVCSANDSCVALAERIGGSEADFVARMNERAKELGAENTLFANCTGLPKDPQYSCAKDVATMLRAMLSHDLYYRFSKIWYEDFRHPDGRTTRITNTNKLIKQYAGCDGGKTGFTSEAGYCLAATAKRGETRLVSVVIGAESAAARNKAVSELFDHAFGRYEVKTVLAGTLEEKVPVRGSVKREISCRAERPLKLFAERGATENYTVDLRFGEDLKAPLAAGDRVGQATLFSNGVEIASTPLVAAEDAPPMRWWDALRDIARKWQ